MMRRAITVEFVREHGGRFVPEGGAGALLKCTHTPAAVQGTARDIAPRCEFEQRQAALMEIVRELAAHQDSGRLFPRIAQWACELLRVDGAFVALVEGDGLTIRGAYGMEAPCAGAVWSIARSGLGTVVRSGLPQAGPDVSRDGGGDDAALVTRLGYRAILTAPIAVGEDVQGVLCAVQKSPRSFLAEDVALLAALSAHTAVTLDRARLVRELKIQLRERETLLNVSQAIGSSLDLVETMRRVARETARALGADTVGAYLADPDHRALRAVAGYHVPRHLLDRFMNVPIPLQGSRVLQAAWAAHHPVWMSAAETDPLVDAEITAQFPHRSALFVPMVIKGEPIGGLFVSWWGQHRPFTGEEIGLVEGISRQAALGVERARLYEQLSAAHDELETLAGIGRELAQTLDLDQVIGLILQQVMFITQADLAYIALSQDGGNARVVACHGQRTSLLENFFVRPGSGLAGRALDTGQIQEATGGDVDLDAVAAEGAQAILVVPLKVASRHVGLLWLGRRTAVPFGAGVKLQLQRLNLSLAVALDHARLYKQVADKTIEMESANNALTDALRLQAEFLNNTSHELRTPLTAILGLLRAVLGGLCTGRDEEREFIANAHACADELQILINNILDMAKADAGKLELDIEAVDLADLFEGLRRLVQGQLAAKPGLTLTLEAPAPEWRTIPVDAMRLKQILLNLLNNSLKFTAEGAITVRAVARPEAGFMTITVADTGIGVPPERQGRLFEKFVQGDGSTTRSHGGTGLGLAISKRLVEMMGGVIALESGGIGQGTTVSLSLPLSQPRPMAVLEHGDATVQGPNERPLILLVEDSDRFRDVLRDFFHGEGFQTAEARTAEEGLEQAERLHPALVITDLALTCVPSAVVRNGLDLIVAVSDRPGFRDLPMIMLTGAVAEARALLGTRAGLPRLRLLEKPIDLRALRSAVDTALKGSASRGDE
jgi:signal transduction histidine kinase/ActR/RegA family two-component response regulator